MGGKTSTRCVGRRATNKDTLQQGDMDWRALNAAPLEKRKEVARKTRSLRLLTDATIRDHLEGKVTIGIYPLLPDETCSLLAVDFDKSGWQQDAGAFLAACHRFNVPAALERSRSGNGGHIWFFFDSTRARSRRAQTRCCASYPNNGSPP